MIIVRFYAARSSHLSGGRCVTRGDCVAGCRGEKCLEAISAEATSSTLAVVAAESVYGNIVSQIGGSHVSVTSILSDPNADPHLYEPGTANALAVAKAKL